MDIISLYYFSELAKDMRITHTANRLFVTQQTLSNHLARLEEYYGTQLMYRKPTLSLTTAGEFVLSFADIVSKEHINLKDILSDVERQERGTLRFGASPLRVNTCLPHILPEFTKRYPQVELHITDAMSAQLEPMVLSGELDFAAVLSAKPDPELVSDQLMRDPVYLCVSDALLRQYYGDEAETLRARAIHGADVADFAKLPFCLHTNRLGTRINECFLERGIAPNAYVTTSDTLISLSLCIERLAACFATHMRLFNQKERIPDDMNIFPLYVHGEPLTQTLTLIRRKDRYLAHYSKLFLDLLFRYFSDVEHIQMERMA